MVDSPVTIPEHEADDSHLDDRFMIGAGDRNKIRSDQVKRIHDLGAIMDRRHIDSLQQAIQIYYS